MLWEIGFAITVVAAILPVFAGIASPLRSPELRALVADDEDHAHRCQRGWNDKNQDSAAQRLNHPRSSGRGLSVAECTTLREGRRGEIEAEQSARRHGERTR